MAFIRFQKVKVSDSGAIIGGTAAIIDVSYVRSPGNSHSKQTVRERLGTPIYISDDRKSGIFNSPTRGIVEYDVVKDLFKEVSSDDERLSAFAESRGRNVHSVFGDAYVFMCFLKNMGMTGVLGKVLTRKPDLERCIMHLYHRHMSNASKDRCDLFCENSFITSVMSDVPVQTLRTDTYYFETMGGDNLRLAFFTAFAEMMRRTFPDFGKSCYVDSTPLPNEAKDNPFNAFNRHGTGEATKQTRLVLVLDKASGLPVWFKTIPGNVTDVNTLKDIADDVKVSIGMEICDYVLDAGYASKSLIKTYGLGPFEEGEDGPTDGRDTEESWEDPDTEYEPPEKSVLVKMPLKQGYGHPGLFGGIKPLLNNGKYDFCRDGHAYFGKRRKHVLFGQKIYAYVYVDHDNALNGYRKFMSENPEEFSAMKDKDRTWCKYRSGFFVLLSNLRSTPQEILDMYFGRTDIETVFKTSKEYLSLLPLNKWTVRTVHGKILSDMVSLIVYLSMRRTLSGTPFSMTETATRLRSLICSVDGKGVIRVDTPNKQVREIFAALSVPLPADTDLEKVRSDCLM